MDEVALNQLFKELFPRLLQMAEQKIAPGMKHRVEASDVAATVIRTILRRIKENKFHFYDEESLAKQLWVITVNRLANKIREANSNGRLPWCQCGTRSRRSRRVLGTYFDYFGRIG